MNAKLKFTIFVAIQLLSGIYVRDCAAETLFDKSIVVVEYDAKSENALGIFPSRAAIASYVEKIKRGRPKAIVLKFFFDGPGTAEDNLSLEKSFGGANILLQASLNKEPPTSRQLDDHFFFAGKIGEYKIALKGDEGWLPIKQLAKSASKVCFAGVRQVDSIPVLVEFQGKPIPSMWACILEEMPDGGKLELAKNGAVFGKYWLPLDTFGETKVSLKEVNLKDLDGGPSVSVADLMTRDFDAEVFASKIVLLTYTGSKSPLIAVGKSSYKVHNVFVAELRALFGLLRPIK